MKLISWNVNGLRAVHRKNCLYPFIEQHKPDILCLQETKSHIEQLSKDLIEIPGYHSIFESGIRKGYSGVALYTKTMPVSVQTGFKLEDKFDQEGRIIIATYPHFILFNIYFPNGGARPERLQYKLDFYQSMLQYLDALDYRNQPIIITGDVNTAHHEIDLARPKENVNVSGFMPIERVWIDTLINDYGFIDTFRMYNQSPEVYTWWDMKTRARERNVGWRIDYVFVNQALKDNVREAFVLPEVFGSDHCPVGVDLIIE